MKSATKSRKTFAAQVKKTRQEKGMRLEDLHQSSGLSYNYLSAVENGRVNISLDNADAIARALGVPLAFLFIENPS